MAFHFHVCGECFAIWGHDPENEKSKASCWPHDCPKCDAGPFIVGFSTRRSADEEKIRLKAAAKAPAL